jgi:CRISPR-associated protein Csc2
VFLNSVRAEDFHTAIPELPMGKYAHIILVRETTSFPLFQTDSELNTSYVQAGLDRAHGEVRARITLFKRKQVSAERLHGRELLRRYGIITADKPPATKGAANEPSSLPHPCEYNSADFCKVCPDCILYGYAIGTQGSERAKVMSDSAFSLTPFDVSHQTLTFNAPFENGTMSRGGETRSSIGEQDHVLPQVFFPAIITLRDPTEAGFLYVLNNVLRTSRYGAQTTRTGTVDNHLIGVVFANGEIFSNLKFTQALYDQVGYADGKEQAQIGVPLATEQVCAAARALVPALLAEDGLVTHWVDGATLLAEVNALTRDEDRLRAVLDQAAREALTYATSYGVFRPKEKAKGK